MFLLDDWSIRYRISMLPIACGARTRLTTSQNQYAVCKVVDAGSNAINVPRCRPSYTSFVSPFIWPTTSITWYYAATLPACNFSILQLLRLLKVVDDDHSVNPQLLVVGSIFNNFSMESNQSSPLLSAASGIEQVLIYESYESSFSIPSSLYFLICLNGSLAYGFQDITPLHMTTPIPCSPIVLMMAGALNFLIELIVILFSLCD